MARTNTNSGGGGAGVSSLNGLTNAVILAAGAGITLTPVGQTITIAATGGAGTPSLPLQSIQYNTAGAFDGDALFIRDAVSNYTDLLKDFSVSEQGGFRIAADITGGNFPNAVPGSFIVSEDTVKNLYAFSGAGDIGGILGVIPGIATNSTVMAVYNSVTGDSARSLVWYYDGSFGGIAGMRHETDITNGTLVSGFSADTGGFDSYADDLATGDSTSINLSPTQATIRYTSSVTNFDTGFFAGTAGPQMFIKPIFTATKDWTLSVVDDITVDMASLSYSNITDNHRYFLISPFTSTYLFGDVTAGSSGNNNYLEIQDNNQLTNLWTTNLHIQSPNALNAPLIYIDSVISHTRIGYNAGGNSSLLAGAQNTYVGYEAGFGTTGSLGQGNTAVGYRAGYSLDTVGDGNSLFGNNAGDSITTGQSNTAFGYGAGQALTTQSDNALFGTIAGGVLTGAQNAFFGTNSGGVSTTADQNSFFGVSAGLENISGDNNVYIGYLSGDNGVTGGSNVIIGSEAGFTVSRSSSIGIGRNVSIDTDNQLRFGSGAHPILFGDIGDYADAGNGIGMNWNNTARTMAFGHLYGAGNNTKFRIDDSNSAAIVDGAQLIQFNTSNRIHLNGGQRIKRAAINNADYTITTADYVLSMENLSASRTITVPDASTAFAGQSFIIKDADGLAATFNIVLDPTGTDTIDDAATFTMATNYQSVTLVSDGVSNWEVI